MAFLCCNDWLWINKTKKKRILTVVAEFNVRSKSVQGYVKWTWNVVCLWCVYTSRIDWHRDVRTSSKQKYFPVSYLWDRETLCQPKSACLAVQHCTCWFGNISAFASMPSNRSHPSILASRGIMEMRQVSHPNGFTALTMSHNDDIGHHSCHKGSTWENWFTWLALVGTPHSSPKLEEELYISLITWPI